MRYAVPGKVVSELSTVIDLFEELTRLEMNPSRPLAQKKNLLLAFDAFGTLFYPKEPVTKQYARFADAHGIRCSRSDISIRDTFKSAYKYESSLNPNYGKATGLGAEKWWASVRASQKQTCINNIAGLISVDR